MRILGNVLCVNAPRTDYGETDPAKASYLLGNPRKEIEAAGETARAALTAAEGALPKTGGTLEGSLHLNGHALRGLAPPTADDEGVNKGYADAIRALAEGKLSLELLWENASSDSDFPAQTIPLSLSGFRRILVEFVAAVPAMLIHRGMTAYAASANVTRSDVNAVVVDMRRRTLSFDDTGVTFGDNNRTMYTDSAGAFNGLSTYNSGCKPLRIYGVKGE